MSHQIKKAFTLVEMLVVIAIIGILSTGIYSYAGRAREKTRYSRAKEELKQLGTALQHYLNDHSAYPADVNRGLPNGLEDYIKRGNWPNGPWEDSVYDWDNWVINGDLVAQISLRFGTNPNNFNPPPIFPQFTYYSALYYCVEGECVSHKDHPVDPGLCTNCGQDENTVLWGGS